MRRIDETNHEIDVAGLRRQELGQYLRCRRAELSPEEVGLSRQPRRRVSGLRRYEVAELAAVSDTWYTWLEQGRNINVSADALDSIARALRLDDPARRHLRRLAGVPVVDPVPASPIVPDYSAVLSKMDPYPACVTTVALDMVQWNRAYAALAGDPATIPPHERNTLVSLFKHPVARRHMRDWQTEARAMVARFRYESGRFLGEPRFAEVLDELLRDSEEFRAMWSLGQVRPQAEPMLTVDHPEVGQLDFVKFQMSSASSERLVLTVYQAADEATHQHLGLLLAAPEPLAPPVAS